jgi:hypothetical protein
MIDQAWEMGLEASGITMGTRADRAIRPETTKPDRRGIPSLLAILSSPSDSYRNWRDHAGQPANRWGIGVVVECRISVRLEVAIWFPDRSRERKHAMLATT